MRMEDLKKPREGTLEISKPKERSDAEKEMDRLFDDFDIWFIEW